MKNKIIETCLIAGLKRLDAVYGLSFDGGGGRAIFNIRWLKLFCQKWGVPQSDLHLYFDVIAGSSAGGIIALAIAYGMTLDQIEEFFINEIPMVFTIRTSFDFLSGSINASYPSNRPNKVQKAGILLNNDQFYRSVSPDSNYGSARLKSALTAIFGNSTLQDLKTSVVITAYDLEAHKPLLFSNLNFAEYTGQDELIVNVALATAAPPLYLPPVLVGGRLLIDGGVFMNSPVEYAVSACIVQKPKARRLCIMSLGTGKNTPGVDEPDSIFPTLPAEDAVLNLLSYIDSSTQGTQEAINDNYEFLAKDSSKTDPRILGASLYFYRLQEQVPPDIYGDIDNTDQSFIDYLQGLSQVNYNDNIQAIDQFIKHMSP